MSKALAGGWEDRNKTTSLRLFRVFRTEDVV